MTARGAADFLTRATSILGALFIILSISLAAIAGVSGERTTVDTSLVNETAPAVPAPVQQTAPPLAQPDTQQPAESAPAQQNQDSPAVPLAQ